MLSVNVLQRLRPCVVPQLLSKIPFTFGRHAALLSMGRGVLSGGVSGNQLTVHGVRRSAPIPNKVQFHCPSTRGLSTAPCPEDEQLIYTGSLSTAIRVVKIFSYSSSGATMCLMPHILMETGIGVDSVALKVIFCGIVGFFTFVNPVLIHLISKGFVMRLYHNPVKDTYTAITYSVFLTEKKNIFHQSQVRIPDISKMFTTFYAGKMGFLVNPDLFTIPHDYNHLMGYDKPFSFSTDDIDQPDRS